MPPARPIAKADDVPPLFMRDVDRDIPDRAVCWYEGSERTPALRRALTEAERHSLEFRASGLRNALAPYEDRHKDTLAAAIAGMLAGFPAMARHDDETAVALTWGYLCILRDRPPWAIARACEMVRAGRAGLNPSFCPSEPEFNLLVGRVTAEYAERLRKTEAMLRAKVAA